jgi:hypothetical protein
MRAMRAETFSGYGALKLVELPKPTVTDGKVLVRITAAGVTPLDHTILSGKFHTTKVPLVLGNEGAGVVEEGGGTDFPVGSRVMFWGTYGAFEDGTYSEWIAVRKEDLCLIPDGVDDVERSGYSGRVSDRASGSCPGWFSCRQNRSGTGDRGIGWQRGNATGAGSGSKTRHIEHDQPCESGAGEGARIQRGHRYFLGKVG